MKMNHAKSQEILRKVAIKQHVPVVDTTNAVTGDLMRRVRRSLEQWQFTPGPDSGLRYGGDSSPDLIYALGQHCELLQNRLNEIARLMAQKGE